MIIHPLTHPPSTLPSLSLSQEPGKTEVYLLEEPTYVKFHTTPLPPPEPAQKKGKKGKGGGGKKGKKEKVIPPPPFTCSLDDALENTRLGDKGGKQIDEVIANLAKKYEEEKKAAEKLAAEKAKAKAQAEKEAKAKAAKEGGGKKK